MNLLDINTKKLCACGKIHESSTKNITTGKNLTEQLYAFIEQNFGSKAKDCVICDYNTYPIAQNYLKFHSYTARLDIKSHHADEYMIEMCDDIIKGKEFDYFIACGSGTIHDITRIIAHKYNKPFISYPTAPSVDGFASVIAPITTKNGMKISVPAVAPIAIFADIDVLANAPKRLTASGVADILGKYTALADWRVANLLTNEYICDSIIESEYVAVNKVKDSLSELKKDMDNQSLYEKFCFDLIEALIISGLCMQYTGNSRPASGAEHHIAHLFEMNIILSTNCLHGENVGFGTILCSDLYHRLAESNNIKFIENYALETDLIDRYYTDIRDLILEENAPNSVKNITPENFYNNLESIKKIISDIPASEELAELFGLLGGVNDLSGIKAYNLKCEESEIIPLALKLAPYIRNRLTLLKMMRCIEF